MLLNPALNLDINKKSFSRTASTLQHHLLIIIIEDIVIRSIKIRIRIWEV